MDVTEPEKLERGAFSFNRFTAGVIPDRGEIVQENDVEGTFVDTAPVNIPRDLMEAIQRTSRDPDVEEVATVPVEVNVDADKVAEENPTSRFRILNAAIKKPGICILCRSAGGDGRQFVDFGQSVEFLGVVYFCTFCVGEVAKLLGYATYAKHDDLFKQYEASLLKLGNEVLETQFLREQLDAARLLLRNSHCDGCNCGDSVSDSVPVDVETVPDGDETSDDGDESGSSEESGDVSESPVDDAAELESEPEPEKPKRTRRGSSVTSE